MRAIFCWYVESSALSLDSLTSKEPTLVSILEMASLSVGFGAVDFDPNNLFIDCIVGQEFEIRRAGICTGLIFD